MTREGAESAVTASALIVGGIYVFRRLSETDVQLTSSSGLRLKQLAGAGPVMPAGPFVTGWGFTFLVISLMAQAAPDLGGSFALLVAAGAVLGNGVAVSQDISSKLGAGAGAGSSGSSFSPEVPPTVANAPAPGQHLYPYVLPQGHVVAH